MDFYSRRTIFSPTLGLEEGESRKQCPPGTVKSYLPDFPWSECIPEEKALRPYDFPSTVRSPGPTAVSVPAPGPTRAPLPPVAPAPAPPPAAPRKARFLLVDHQTGSIIDPDTGAVVETATAYTIDAVDTVAIAGGLGLVALLLTLAGVFE
jgi:hypothetical protein